MNITVKSDNKIDLIRKIQLVVSDVSEKNKEYYEHGVVLELAQSIEQIIKNIYRTSNDEYVANVLFYSIPLQYNYHGMISNKTVSR